MNDQYQLASHLVEHLSERGLHITTVESCTGGGLVNCITNVSGASAVIKDARVTYSNEAKIALGVPAEVIDQYGVYSLETAIAMAKAGVAKSVQADIGVGITGSISRVDPANPDSVPGEVYIAAIYGEQQRAEKYVFADEAERWEVKDSAIHAALSMVTKLLSDDHQ
ncbi:MAG: nicotinamide-nucleotide amidohydrolase family protein [Pseudomonadota bacterium]